MASTALHITQTNTNNLRSPNTHRAAAKAEGELIRRKAADEATELAAKEAAWRAKAKEMNAATKVSTAVICSDDLLLVTKQPLHTLCDTPHWQSPEHPESSHYCFVHMLRHPHLPPHKQLWLETNNAQASNDTLLAFRAAERQREKQLEAAVEGVLLWWCHSEKGTAE